MINKNFLFNVLNGQNLLDVTIKNATSIRNDSEIYSLFKEVLHAAILDVFEDFESKDNCVLDIEEVATYAVEANVTYTEDHWKVLKHYGDINHLDLEEAHSKMISDVIDCLTYINLVKFEI